MVRDALLSRRLLLPSPAAPALSLAATPCRLPSPLSGARLPAAPPPSAEQGCFPSEKVSQIDLRSDRLTCPLPLWHTGLRRRAGGTAGTSQSLGGCSPAHLGAQQGRCPSRRGRGSTPTCTRVHRRTHKHTSLFPWAQTHAHSRAPTPHMAGCASVCPRTPSSPTRTRASSPCFQLQPTLSLPWLLGLALKASVMGPQQTAPATPPQASLDTPGPTAGAEPLHLCLSIGLCVCGGVSHSGGAPGQTLRAPLYRHLLSEPERVCTTPLLSWPCPGQHQTLTCPELVLNTGEGGWGGVAGRTAPGGGSTERLHVWSFHTCCIRSLSPSSSSISLSFHRKRESSSGRTLPKPLGPPDPLRCCSAVLARSGVNPSCLSSPGQAGARGRAGRGGHHCPSCHRQCRFICYIQP